MAPTAQDYLYAKGENRERLVVNFIIANGEGFPDPLLRPFFRGSHPWLWLGLRIPKVRLLPGLGRPDSEDIDILGSALAPASPEEYDACGQQEAAKKPEAHPNWHHQLASTRIRDEGKLRWPPDMRYLVAAEAKVSHVSEDLSPKGTKRSSEGVKQARNLCDLGFDKVALLKIVVTAPIPYGNGNPWFGAAHTAGIGIERVMEVMKETPMDSWRKEPFGCLVFGSGAVPGRLEGEASAECIPMDQEVPVSPRRSQCLPVRKRIEEKLARVMAQHSVPKEVPILLLACEDAKCGNLYIAEANPEMPCPKCGSPPR